MVKYRKKLVRKNLENAFPDKSIEEIIAIEKSFYHHFCDYFFETVKLLHISDTQMKKHFIFQNSELLQDYLKAGQPVILKLGHYGNWEWVTSITLWVKDVEDTVIGQVYRPLKNKVFDLFFLKLRARFHSVGFIKNDTYREIIKMRKTGKNWMMGFISDQKPSYRHILYWTNFLNQDTPMLIGSEKIAKHENAVICYLDITYMKRGCYVGDVKLITDHSAEAPEFEITEKYIRMMEETILRNPACYLWTHNRWKYKR